MSRHIVKRCRVDQSVVIASMSYDDDADIAGSGGMGMGVCACVNADAGAGAVDGITFIDCKQY